MPAITLVPWSDDDLDTLRRSNADEMMTYLGGPETEEQLVARHERYLRLAREGTARMFRIGTDAHPEGVGVIGFWQTEHEGLAVYEAGWSVETAHQGQGIASESLVAVIALARADGERPALHAYPRVDNLASNAICRKAGMELRGEFDFEYPPGTPIRCNDWAVRFDA
ncbi:MAG: GNAT family N-acetyltransferase [Leifsonia sp.]